MIFKNQDKIIENGKTDILKKIRRDILSIFSSAINSVDPYKSVKSKFDNNKIKINSKIFEISDYNNIYLVGFGKASVGMAQAVCDSIEIKKGAVVTNDKTNKVKNSNIETYIGSHPIPEKGNIRATEKIIEIIKKCKKNDFLIVLISGGGSALLSKPLVGLKDLQQTTNLLLKSGANINEINTIRKHLSEVKGGKLATFCNCTMVSLIISDIIDDPIDFIASGPTYPDKTTFSDASSILKKYNLENKIPENANKIIKNGIKGIIPETPKKENIAFKKVFNFIVANNKIACKSAKDKSEKLGYQTILLTTSLEGEAKNISKFLVEKAKNFLTDEKRFMFISGGETTVTIKGKGKGGRNQEMVLSIVNKISDSNIVFSSFATDGIDGICDAAGAIADKYSYKRALNKNLDVNEFLNNNNSYEFFKKLDDLFITGPTGTNVMDIQILVKF